MQCFKVESDNFDSVLAQRWVGSLISHIAGTSSRSPGWQEPRHGGER
jgi:hypothetical protein